TLWVTQLAYFLFFWSTLLFFLIYSTRGKNTIFQIGFITYLDALRKKIFFILALFALGTLGYSVFLSSVLPKDQLKILQTICFTTATLFGGVVAIFLSATVIPKDIKDKTIFSIIPKPVRRFEYILGRLLGCWMVLAVLLFSMLLMCLFLIEWTLFDLGKESPALSEELASARLPYRPIKILDGQRKEILVCKQCLQRVASITQICKKNQGTTPSTCSPEKFSTLYQQYPNLLIPLQDEIIFVYQQLPLKQFKQGTSEEKIESPLQIHFSVPEGFTRRIPFLFHFENPETKERISQKIFLPNGKEYWSYFPSKCISGEGCLNIVVSRLHPDLNWVGFGSLLVFGSVGRVEWIFIKCFFLLYLMLLLLSLLALTCSTFLSTPVAVVFTGFLYLLGQMLEFLREFVESLRKKGGSVFHGIGEALSHEESHHHGNENGIEQVEKWGSLMTNWIGDGIEFFCNYFIDFTRFDLTYLLRIGVDIPFHLFTQQIQYFCFCCFPLLAITYISFRYRELS
ncbi:MAG: ABC transporter permease, partial [Planctomycetota bacterium]